MEPIIKELSEAEQARFDKAVEDNIDMILSKEGVISFGVGRKTRNGKLTDEICLVVCVKQKKSGLPPRELIDKEIDGLPTDVVEVATNFNPLDENPVPPAKPEHDSCCAHPKPVQPEFPTVADEPLICAADSPPDGDQPTQFIDVPPVPFDHECDEHSAHAGQNQTGGEPQLLISEVVDVQCVYSNFWHLNNSPEPSSTSPSPEGGAADEPFGSGPSGAPPANASPGPSSCDPSPDTSSSYGQIVEPPVFHSLPPMVEAPAQTAESQVHIKPGSSDHGVKPSGTTGDRISSRIVYEPLKAGMAIHNKETSVDDVGVLGAIVFDKNDTTKTYGLSVFHAIGNKWGRWESNPIVQPPHTDNEIGTLYKRDKDLDVALFELNKKRKIEAKVVGGKDEDDIELEEPIHARIGQKVECLARSGLIKGVVADVWTSRIGTKSITTVYIKFDSTRTDAGDSGSIWIESGTRHPIGLHRGLDYRMHDLNDYTVYARATCINCLIQHFHPIQFKQKKIDKFKEKLGEHQSTVMKAPSGNYLAFCFQQSAGQPFKVQKFDKKLKLIETVETGLAPKSAVAATRFGNEVYAAWASADKNKIQLGIFSESKFRFTETSTCKFSTTMKPALASRKKMLVMAFNSEGTIKVRYSKNGKDWSKVAFRNAKTDFAPCLVKFGNKIIVYWVESQTHKIKTADLLYLNDRKGPRLEAHNFFNVGNYQASNDLAVTAGGGKVFLAFSTLGNELRVIESPNGWGSWRLRHSDPNKLVGSPTLAFVNGNLQYNRLDG